MNRVLLTGATGSLGRYIALELLAGGCELVLVARGRTRSEATTRVLGALGIARDAGVTVIRGDVTQPDLGLGRADARSLAREVDGIVHSAATTDFGLPLAYARATNVVGTANVLAFARRVSRLSKLAHVSTAFVAGRRSGRILEHELLHDAGFVNTYERSKYEAEQLVRTFHTTLPIAILRPSVVVEPAEDTCRPSALRFALRLIARGFLPVLPAAPTTRVDLIAAIDAAAAVASAYRASDGLGTFHLCSGERAPRLTDVVTAATGRGVRFVDRETFAGELAGLRNEHSARADAYDALATFIDALAHPKTFDTTAAEALLAAPPCRTDPLSELVASPPAAGAVAT